VTRSPETERCGEQHPALANPPWASAGSSPAAAVGARQLPGFGLSRPVRGSGRGAESGCREEAAPGRGRGPCPGWGLSGAVFGEPPRCGCAREGGGPRAGVPARQLRREGPSLRAWWGFSPVPPAAGRGQAAARSPAERRPQTPLRRAAAQRLSITHRKARPGDASWGRPAGRGGGRGGRGPPVPGQAEPLLSYGGEHEPWGSPPCQGAPPSSAPALGGPGQPPAPPPRGRAVGQDAARPVGRTQPCCGSSRPGRRLPGGCAPGRGSRTRSPPARRSAGTRRGLCPTAITQRDGRQRVPAQLRSAPQSTPNLPSGTPTSAMGVCGAQPPLAQGSESRSGPGWGARPADLPP